MGTPASERAARPRIQTLSDLIFGLALSISALTLVGRQPATSLQFASSLGLYAFSFFIVISVWELYSSVSSVLPSETALLVNLNVVLLFFVSIEPYLFDELFVLQGDMSLLDSGIYSIDLAAMFFVIAFFFHALTHEEKHLVPKPLLQRYKVDRDIMVLTALILAVSVVPYFGDTIILNNGSGGPLSTFSLRNVVWVLALLIGWSRRLVIALLARRDRPRNTHI
jgi:uncharacterized membrane protein